MLSALAALLLAASPAAAVYCLPRDQAVARLTNMHSEQQVGIGVGPGGFAVYELWVSESGSWTILFTRPNKITCIIATGDSWRSRPLLTGQAL